MGLVDYDSDSDASGANSPVPEKKVEEKAPTPPNPPSIETEVNKETQNPPAPPPEPPSDAPIVGPALPPTEDDADDPLLSPTGDDGDDPPQSPYSASRNLIHSLTLPPIIPEIPPSPPGSPKPALAKKFAHFQTLKSQGVHFNEKLLRSSALNNPNLLGKLSAFVGLEKEDFYATNVNPEVWDPKAFPESTYFEQLDKAQEKVSREREERKAKEARDKLEFVSSVEKPKESRWGVEPGKPNKARDPAPVRGREDRGDGKGDHRTGSGRDERDGKYDDRRRGRDRGYDDRERKRRRSRSSSRPDKRHETGRDREGRYRDYDYGRRR
ncbi:HCNGP-domain-containing protein [Ascodesmis nigricans]|uniref:HCNGP-domain-containing protein n=1 Tax=Ascodesmis nigricans TaxID=341454 RepID=A0A4S2N2P8_9PEZI|nr:HCNGP-domain-containing protein [Ascodesmis nigricans]